MPMRISGRRPAATALATALSLLCTAGALAADAPRYLLTLGEQQFNPAVLELPADTKVEITVRNTRASKGEFESLDLRRERLIPAGSEVVLYVGPLPRGEYEFFDDFLPQARGRIVVR